MHFITGLFRRRSRLSAQQAAWEGVYRDLYPRVYNFFRFRLHDDALAEDLTATTFERAWRHRATFQEERGEFAGWLFGIARRVAAIRKPTSVWASPAVLTKTASPGRSATTTPARRAAARTKTVWKNSVASRTPARTGPVCSNSP